MSLNWTKARDHNGFRADIHRTDAEGEIKIFDEGEDWLIKAWVNGHVYETRVAGQPFHARDYARWWLDKVIATRGQDAKEVSN